MLKTIEFNEQQCEFLIILLERYGSLEASKTSQAIITGILEKLVDKPYEDEKKTVVKTALCTCNHECTSNCRRSGCNCQCGEYHADCEGCEDEPDLADKVNDELGDR